MFIVLPIGLIIIIFIANFLGNTAFIEQNQTTIVYLAGSARIYILINLILLAAFYIKRSLESREVEFILAKPISREKFLLSYLISFTLLTLMIEVFLAVLILITTKPSLYGLVIWSFSLILESIIIISFTIVTSLITQSAIVSIMASIGFYVISRMMGFFLFLIDHNEIGSKESLLKLISSLLPRLDLFSQTKWLIYGINDISYLPLLVVQAMIYTALLFSIAVIDFRRKEL
jgi:ABC-type transport system involved in multi-copper enzyme maturation permease subunit